MFKRRKTEKCELAGKPGFVLCFQSGNYSSRMHVTIHLKQPTRPQRGPRHRGPIWSCSGWSLPCHELLPAARCALTAPFHPYLILQNRPSAVCSLLHWSSAHAAQVLPGTLPCGARTFLPLHKADSNCPGQLTARIIRYWLTFTSPF